MEGNKEPIAAISTTVSAEITIELAAPPSVLTFESLADLYDQYQKLLVKCNHECPRGKRILFENYHFFHLVKLHRPKSLDDQGSGGRPDSTIVIRAATDVPAIAQAVRALARMSTPIVPGA